MIEIEPLLLEPLRLRVMLDLSGVPAASAWLEFWADPQRLLRLRTTPIG